MMSDQQTFFCQYLLKSYSNLDPGDLWFIIFEITETIPSRGKTDLIITPAHGNMDLDRVLNFDSFVLALSPVYFQEQRDLSGSHNQ